MRYFVKINPLNDRPVPNSLVYANRRPRGKHWFEIIPSVLNEEGNCIQPKKPNYYASKIKHYYSTDEFCQPIAGSNISAYACPPGHYIEYFPSCCICVACEMEGEASAVMGQK